MANAFLKADRIRIPVVNATPRGSISELGDRGRGFRGEVHDMTRGARRAWDMTACFLEDADGFAEAEAFERHIVGEGHRISFGNGLQASTGLNPLAGWGDELFWIATAGFADENGYINLTDGILQYDAELDDVEWTILFRQGATFESGGEAWRSDGIAYENGVRTTWTPGGVMSSILVSVKDGIATLQDDGSATNLDDLIILPFKASDGQLVTWTGGSDGEGPLFGPLPVHRITGDFISEDVAFMAGAVRDTRYIQKQQFGGNVSTMWVNNGKIVDFTLVEVPETYRRADML